MSAVINLPIFSSGGGSPQPSGLIVGEVRNFAGISIPANWLECIGQTVLITSYPSLFAVIGTTYGGDGSNDFILPDLRGRTAVGVGNGSGLTPVSLGQTLGSETKALSETNIAAHTHTYAPLAYNGLGNADTPGSNYHSGAETTHYRTTGTVPMATQVTASTGSGTAFSIVQPSLGLKSIIYAGA